jgi:hypothetical protein
VASADAATDAVTATIGFSAFLEPTPAKSGAPGEAVQEAKAK